jgi:hypothetical protein
MTGHFAIRCWLIFVFAHTSAAVAQQAASVKPESESKLQLKLLPRPANFPPFYRSTVRRGAPGETEPMVLRTLSPAIGAAASASTCPRLFWFQSKSSGGKLLLVLRDAKSTRALAKVPIREDLPAGTQSIDLPPEVALEPGGVYLWTITYKPTTNVLHDVTVRGELVILKDGAKLMKDVENLAPRERIFRLAEAGAWYDVLAGIQDLQKKGEGVDSDLQTLWSDILGQGGLTSDKPGSDRLRP